MEDSRTATRDQQAAYRWSCFVPSMLQNPFCGDFVQKISSIKKRPLKLPYRWPGGSMHVRFKSGPNTSAPVIIKVEFYDQNTILPGANAIYFENGPPVKLRIQAELDVSEESGDWVWKCKNKQMSFTVAMEQLPQKLLRTLFRIVEGRGPAD